MTNTESTSLLNLGTHSNEYPTVQLSHAIPVTTTTLARLLGDFPAPQLLALDIQGVELRAIKGYGERISEVVWIYCEVNKAELYEGCCLIYDLDVYLKTFGFKRTATKWTNQGWGDALYENTQLINNKGVAKGTVITFLLINWKIRISLSKIKHLVKGILKDFVLDSTKK
jgi:hypothetical protein